MARPRPPPPPGPARLLPPLLLLLLLHLPGAAPWGAPRSPLDRSHEAARPQRLKTETLSAHTAKPRPVEQQLLVATQSHPHLQDPHGHGLIPGQLSWIRWRQLWWVAARRRKRHAAPRLHHGQLMRVGCVLGTCQVQNLGHRLWQLKGQSGRQDASPMNPNSPHSYG